MTIHINHTCVFLPGIGQQCFWEALVFEKSDSKCEVICLRLERNLCYNILKHDFNYMFVFKV